VKAQELEVRTMNPQVLHDGWRRRPQNRMAQVKTADGRAGFENILKAFVEITMFRYGPIRFGFRCVSVRINREVL
jgi:hypothetical protein